MQLGPWDDRNYAVTREDLALLADNEAQLKDPIPVFFRIEMRKGNPGMARTGEAQYPRSALQIFQLRYGGYLVDGKLYRESATTANNHARIQVAFSRDGGATWSVRTPHETADANTVDRFHPWIGVGPDGKVYVMFYDTRRSATRV